MKKNTKKKKKRRTYGNDEHRLMEIFQMPNLEEEEPNLGPNCIVVLPLVILSILLSFIVYFIIIIIIIMVVVVVACLSLVSFFALTSNVERSSMLGQFNYVCLNCSKCLSFSFVRSPITTTTTTQIKVRSNIQLDIHLCLFLSLSLSLHKYYSLSLFFFERKLPKYMYRK